MFMEKLTVEPYSKIRLKRELRRELAILDMLAEADFVNEKGEKITLTFIVRGFNLDMWEEISQHTPEIKGYFISRKTARILY